MESLELISHLKEKFMDAVEDTNDDLRLPSLLIKKGSLEEVLGYCLSSHYFTAYFPKWQEVQNYLTVPISS